MKRIIIILGLVFSMVAVDAKPQKGPKGKGKALKERFEAAKKKRDTKRGDAKRKGHKQKGPRGEFGKLIRNDEKIKELKKKILVIDKKFPKNFNEFNQLIDKKNKSRLNCVILPMEAFLKAFKTK